MRDTRLRSQDAHVIQQYEFLIRNFCATLLWLFGLFSFDKFLRHPSGFKLDRPTLQWMIR